MDIGYKAICQVVIIVVLKPDTEQPIDRERDSRRNIAGTGILGQGRRKSMNLNSVSEIIMQNNALDFI